MFKKLHLLPLVVFITLLSFSVAFAENQQTCESLYSEMKQLREEIRTLMEDKTAFDTEKDKPLFDSYLRYDKLYKSLFENRCLSLPAVNKTSDIEGKTSLQLFFINSIQFFPWLLEYKNKNVSLYELYLPEKKIPENIKYCVFKFETINDFYGTVISCPFASLEKQWIFTKFTITRNGEQIKDGIVFPANPPERNYIIGMAKMWFELSTIRLEPEIKAWFDKESQHWGMSLQAQ
ncbi:MAG: hypothetical protein HPY60_11025 [Candidatus Methanofastidiosum sp.]|nr:hypothetical protein [Methanofastidiosum sp.]